MDKGAQGLTKEELLSGNSHGECLTTKAQMLQWLKPRLRKSRVLEMYVFSVKRWRRNAEAILVAIRRAFPGQLIIVRSSSRFEDGCDNSNAGVYHSVSSVQALRAHALRSAVEEVIASYDGDPRDQILIQPQLMPVSIAGVVSSHVVPDGQPYYVFSYQSDGGTCGVTGGKDLTTTCYLYRDAVGGSERLPAELLPVYTVMREIEALVGDVPIQLEFGCPVPGDVVVFQVRRLPGTRLPASQISSEVWHGIEQDLQQAMSEAPGLPGLPGLLGVMPDWNPAELLGVHPRPLAVSFYRTLISSGAWCRARFQLGYKDIDARDFLHVLAGRPYVNVRTSFSSLLPAGLPLSSERGLLEAWLDRLAMNPRFHDSIEFDVAQTCVDFRFQQDYSENYEGVLDHTAFFQYAEKLRLLTLNVIRRPVSEDLSLQKGYWDVRSHGGEENLDPSFLSDAVAFGSLPFARIARQAFVAEAMLRSALVRGALSEERLQLFRHSIASIGSRFLLDQQSLQRGAMTGSVFMQRYGHLRPSSFDIRSRCYRDRPGHSMEAMDIPAEEQPVFSLSAKERSSLKCLMKECGFGSIEVEEWLRFVQETIAGREESKFMFSRVLSDLLEQLAWVGSVAGLNRESLSMLEIGEIQMLANGSLAGKDMHDRIDNRHQRYREEKGIVLPSLVRNTSELRCFEHAKDVPHYVGCSRVQAEPLVLDYRQCLSSVVAGKIVCIENADPGFDWIFSQGISGLLTAFGGPNSHMAVRCAELNVSAAIGCGEMVFNKISRGRRLVLDCEKKQLYLLGDMESGHLSLLAAS